MAKQLKPEILELVKNDADLFAEVAKALDNTPPSTISTLNRGSRRLLEFDVLNAISKHTGIEQSLLLIEVEEITVA